jgi:hypothetical protein
VITDNLAAAELRLTVWPRGAAIDMVGVFSAAPLGSEHSGRGRVGDAGATLPSASDWPEISLGESNPFSTITSLI